MFKGLSGQPVIIEHFTPYGDQLGTIHWGDICRVFHEKMGIHEGSLAYEKFGQFMRGQTLFGSGVSLQDLERFLNDQEVID